MEKTYSLYWTGTYITENKKVEYAEFIQKTVAAASFHMTTSDYENPEYVIREAKKTANELYGKETYGLCVVDITRTDCKSNYANMTTEERQIYDSLLRYVR